jgi:ubiquinone/menaquinone biosynthesis C-methylase UbiE
MQKPGKTFYDEHPFDWVGEYTPDFVSRTFTPLLASAIDKCPASALIMDIGCGPGRVMTYMAAKKMRCIGVDASSISVKLMAERVGRPGVVANNLQLPLPDQSVDAVISDGVIHHTADPSRAFAENCRVLRQGGFLYLAVYKPGGRYELLYRYAGAFIRRSIQFIPGRLLVVNTSMVIYYLAHLLKSWGKVTWAGARNLFYDYFVTPRVVFLSYGQIEECARKCGVEIRQYDPNPRLNVHSFLLQKC